jgi:GT2 family glycosyltransferase
MRLKQTQDANGSRKQKISSAHGQKNGNEKPNQMREETNRIFQKSTDNPKISVITVCHKSSSSMPLYVKSFIQQNENQSYTGNIEFVLVENSGESQTETFAQELRLSGFEVQYLETENNGFGSGCNEGARLARGEVLAFVNPDVIFLTEIRELQNAAKKHAWGTVVQKNVSKKNGHCFDLLPEYKNIITELARVHRIANVFPWIRRYCYPVGAFLVVPAKSFKATGGFDERFFMYYEEAELSRRLSKTIGPPRLFSSVEVVHKTFGSESNRESTLRNEADGFVSYARVTNQMRIIQKRIWTIRLLSRFFPGMAHRAMYLEDAVKRSGCGLNMVSNN